MKIQSSSGEPLNDFSFSYSNEKEKRDKLRDIRLDYIEQGYLEAGFDSIGARTSILHIGPQYRVADIHPGNVDEEILSIIGFRAKVYHDIPIDIDNLAKLYEQLLQYYENHGHPFASVGLDSIIIKPNGVLTGQLHSNPGPFVQIDTIFIKGDARIAHQLFQNYINISPGDPFDQSKINAISRRIKELGYINEIKPAEVAFLPGKAQLYVYITGRNANQLNGVLGVLPDRETGKITITGDARLRLRNAFGRGELVDLNWRKLQALTQDMKLQFAFPYLFNTPIGIDGQLNVYRRDTTFIEVKPRLMLQYLLSGGNYLGLYVKGHTSRLIQPEDFSTSTTLPSFADTRTVLYGLEIFKQRLDYQINPRQGFLMNFSAALGRKEIIPLRELDESLYENIQLNSIQYDATLTAQAFLPLFKRSTIMVGARGALLYNEQMFANEMYRIGGIRTLRGFDEESIRASSYAIGTVEYRFLLEQNSNIYAFFDGAWYEDRTEGNYSRDLPFGFGAGISFQTTPGIFSINYALGSQQGNPILFRSAKVHFGFVNYF